MIASSAFHGSATPSPSASRPQRSQVDGMNCIQPTAPAELGPMLPPKFDSILLIAARTFQGIPYAAPARSQSWCRLARSRRCALTGGVVNETGIEMPPGLLGTLALGRTTRGAACGPEETEKPSTGGPAAPAGPASRASAVAATTRRRISLRLWRVGGSVPPAREAFPRPAVAVPAFARPRRRRAAV